MSVKNALGYKGFPVPIGAIIPWLYFNPAIPVSTPLTYLKCDGSYLQRAQYPDLFNVIGTLYGSTDATNFRIPLLCDDVNHPYIKGSAVNAGTFTPKSVVVDQTVTLDDSNIPPIPALADPVGATMANNVTHPAGWFIQNGNNIGFSGPNEACIGPDSAEHANATASLTSVDINYVNPNVTPLAITTTGTTIHYNSQSSIFLIKALYEPVIPPQPQLVPLPPFPPTVILADKQISGFII